MTPEKWSLGVTGAADAEFSDILTRSLTAGHEELIRTAALSIGEVLLRAPREFGEPLRHFRRMKMTVRTAAIRPLYIEFGVHDEQPMVVIRRFRWMSAPDE